MTSAERRGCTAGGPSGHVRLGPGREWVAPPGGCSRQRIAPRTERGRTVQIEVFSDVVCPWCYIGKRRLEEALSTFAHADEVTVTYRSFQLDPSSPVTSELSLEQMLAQKYGRSLAQARQMNDRVSG